MALISALDGCLLIGQNMHRSKYFEYILCILGTLSQSLKYPCLSQVGLLLLSKVVESNPEPFKPHYRQLLQLFGTVLQDLDNPTAMYYCILTLTAMTAYTGTEEMVRPESIYFMPFWREQKCSLPSSFIAVLK